MKRTVNLTPMLLVLAALLGACGVAREAEPNDSYQQATGLAAGGKAAGTLSGPGDADWYRIEAEGEGTLSVKIGGIRGADFRLAFLDRDRRELKVVDETTVGGDEEMRGLGLSAGIWYLLVTNKESSYADGKQEYSLETKLEAAAGGEREPNDSSLAAQPLEAGGVVKGYYWPARRPTAEDPEAVEEDWYAVEVARPGLFLLNADLSEVPKVDPVLEVYDTNGYRLKELDAGGVGEGESLRSFGVRGPGKFLLRLRSKYKNAGNAAVPYDLMTELLPYQGRSEFEPNDQRADATPLELDAISGTIAPAGDQDWFKISASSGVRAILRAELTGVPGMDLALSLRDEYGTELLLIDNMGKEQPEVLTGWGLDGPERHLVVVEKSGKRADPRAGYELSKRLISAQPGLEWEPNDSTGTLQAIKVGESVDGYFAPKGDRDWYEFNLYQKGVVEVDLTGVINAAPTVALYDQDGVELAAASAAKPGDPVTLTKELDRGTYSLRLTPADPSQNNTRDKYSLVIRAK